MKIEFQFLFLPSSVVFDMKIGFIIIIQLNSIRIEVASTWKLSEHTMELRANCSSPEHSFEMVEIILAFPKVQCQHRDLSMFSMVSCEFHHEKLNFHFPLEFFFVFTQQLRIFNVIILLSFEQENRQHRNIQVQRSQLYLAVLSYLSSLFTCIITFVRRQRKVFSTFSSHH